jgi:hypothetical protein
MNHREQVRLLIRSDEVKIVLTDDDFDLSAGPPCTER